MHCVLHSRMRSGMWEERLHPVCFKGGRAWKSRKLQPTPVTAMTNAAFGLYREREGIGSFKRQPILLREFLNTDRDSPSRFRALPGPSRSNNRRRAFELSERSSAQQNTVDSHWLPGAAGMWRGNCARAQPFPRVSCSPTQR